jgi:predicted DCC family thiol-disulfide oxidoreductase YuxK
MAARDELTVYYDGGCPLCRREIGFYQGCAGSERVRWQDVSGITDSDVAPGLTRTQAMARFHVRTADGEIVSGGAAFARLWSALPRFRALAALCRVPPLPWLLERGYDAFLRFRPPLQRLAASMERR